jgi:porin
MSKLKANLRKTMHYALGITAVAFAGMVEASHPAYAGGDCDEPPPGIWERDTLLGTFDRERTELCDKGYQFGAISTNEILGNTSGGTKRGTTEQGRTEIDLDFDLEKIAELKGLTAHASAMFVYGGRMSSHNLGNLMTISNVESITSQRLYTLWVQQSLYDDMVNFRLGQIAIDDEFLVSKLAAVFVNSTFGFPFMTSGNLPSGGPAFPMPTPGARLKLTFTDELSWMGAAFAGDPGGTADGRDGQWRNHNGTKFSLEGGTLYMTEAAYTVNQEKDSKGLPGTYKIGAWYHSAGFDDLYLDDTGGSLAAATSSGIAARRYGNGGGYVMIDQMILKGQRWSDEGLGVFVRSGLAPSDRNQVPFYVDGGVSYKGLFEGREEDTLALGVAYGELSDKLARLDRETRIVNNQPNRPIRDNETIIELTYQAQVTPWLIVQPDLQYVVHPGGNIPNPNVSGDNTPIKDALVMGLRTAIKF